MFPHYIFPIFTAFILNLYYYTMRQLFLALLFLFSSAGIYAQNVQMKTLPLDDLSAFQEQAGNWMIVGSVTMDPNVDIHHQEAEAQESKKKKKKSKKTKPESEAQQGPVRYQAGTGVLLNMNDDTIKDHLLTSWEHGDILLELEVMMPKGSNSGIYLQGRYEIQLLDSWGVKNPRYGDIGGIYRNWETEPGKIYMGKAPLTNAAKAPGLWQKMKIAFQAPKFDDSGKKVANARFVYVDLNGERIHENVEVPLPTGGPVENNEVAKGPIMIQGDHGPVAFRNIRYRLMEETDVQLSEISYQVYENVIDPASLASASPIEEGTIHQMTTDLPGVDDDFTVVYEGDIVASAASDYQFQLNFVGRAMLEVNGEEQTELASFDQYRSTNDLTLTLSEGKTPFRLVYQKETPQWTTRVGLFSTDSYPRPLHNPNSFLPDIPETGPIYVKVADEPRMLRAFMDYEGDQSQRLTHTIGVGVPSGAHYVYNLITGTPVCVWRGEFLNATPMWYRRGDGSFRPRGAVQYLFPSASLAELPDSNAPFPTDINETGDWQSDGYRIDAQSGLPIFVYEQEDKVLEDFIQPDEAGKMLTRSLTFTEGNPSENLYFKLAEGSDIQQMPDGSYVVDQQYYIRIPSGQSATVRSVNEKQELVASLQNSSFTYSIVW